jgi:predicted nucleotidyltransferase
MNHAARHRDMIEAVALAIGPALLRKVAFVGGCTTALLLTDVFSLEQVRHTDDVDLIVHVIGMTEWYALQAQLRSQGFMDDARDKGPICAMRLGELRVDFMPDSLLLGFTNPWYEQALQSADDYALTTEITIRLVQPQYFVATKLEAYLGRGGNDPLGSQDIEDILSLFDGRDSLVTELAQAQIELRQYVADQLTQLRGDRNFEFAVASAARGDDDRESLIFDRIDAVIAGAA